MDRKERRKHERLPFLDPKSEKNHLIFDLSSMGALFAGKKRVEVGQRISLEVTLPKSMGKLFLPGEIRWVKPIAIEEMHFYLAGMQFAIHDDLTSSTLKAFLQFLRRRIVIRENRSKAVSLLDEISLPKPEKPE
jgi:Tfp pilus assembly protein PilZ